MHLTPYAATHVPFRLDIANAPGPCTGGPRCVQGDPARMRAHSRRHAGASPPCLARSLRGAGRGRLHRWAVASFELCTVPTAWPSPTSPALTPLRQRAQPLLGLQILVEPFHATTPTRRAAATPTRRGRPRPARVAHAGPASPAAPLSAPPGMTAYCPPANPRRVQSSGGIGPCSANPHIFT